MREGAVGQTWLSSRNFVSQGLRVFCLAILARCSSHLVDELLRDMSEIHATP